jgi:hypothetical protein
LHAALPVIERQLETIERSRRLLDGVVEALDGAD